jgi:hypothetical protein
MTANAMSTFSRREMLATPVVLAAITAVGEFDEAEILKTFGDVPEDFRDA